MRLTHALLVLLVLGLLVGAWILVSGGRQRAAGALTRPEDGDRPTFALERQAADLEAGASTAPTPSERDRSRDRAAVPTARPPRSQETQPAQPPERSAAAPPKAELREAPKAALFTLRVQVRAEAGSVAMDGADAVVTARFGDAAETVSGATQLYRALELEVARPPERPVPTSCIVLVDHPAYAPQARVVDLRRVRQEGRDEEGRSRLSVQLTVVLERYAAVLVGEAHGAELVVLARYSAARMPETLVLADVASAMGSGYALRVPRAGEWLVIALREDAHPSYLIVDVQGMAQPQDGGQAVVPLQVGRALSPLETSLHIQSSHPHGYDPAGIELELIPTDPRAAVLGSDGGLIGVRLSTETATTGGFAGGPPFLTWHRTNADAPGGEPWGRDLRGERDAPEHRDSIARVSTRATLDGAGTGRVLGGATGATTLRVEHPFFADHWLTEVVGEIAASDVFTAVLPVARLDVLGFGPAGPLVGGVARVASLPEIGPSSRNRDRQVAPPIPVIGTTLDERGAGQLFVPSFMTVELEVHDAGNGYAATQRMTTPPPCGTRALNVTVTEPAPGRARSSEPK